MSYNITLVYIKLILFFCPKLQYEFSPKYERFSENTHGKLAFQLIEYNAREEDHIKTIYRYIKTI